MGQKIKVTSETLPRIRVTSEKLERLDPEMVASALSAERVEGVIPAVIGSDRIITPAVPRSKPDSRDCNTSAMRPESNDPKSFERLAGEKPPSIAAEFLGFLAENKKWWLLPILIMIGVFGVLVALASTGVAPFIYTMF